MGRYKYFAIFLTIIFLGGGGYWLSQFLGFATSVPKEFSDARVRGALIAQNIVNLSNESALDLAEINRLDRAYSFTEALNLTSDVVLKSREIREQAVALSSQVEAMTRALSDIKNLDARQAALESIANHLALISRLINYSGNLAQLLDSLGTKFSGGNVPASKSVAVLVDQINAEVRAINSFNNQAVQAMGRFDKIVGE